MLKENEVDTLKAYMEDFERELVGNTGLIDLLEDEPCYISVISKLNYLIENNPSVEVYRKDVFKCIRILKNIQTRLFGDDNGQI